MAATAQPRARKRATKVVPPSAANYADEDTIISQAIHILEERMYSRGPQLSSPTTVRNYLQMKLTDEPNEVFAVVFLDAAFQVIVYEHMFNGTAVYPRVVAARCLELHASAILVAHNHPSGRTDPSQADRVLTKSLEKALQLLDIRLLDHFIIGKGQPFSFAENGLM
ncbi:MAG: DNA repair protein RadC [Alcaligenaceae bacterium]|nr:DNA repair protein RadC [Alcaligenaceae bacterium]